VNSELTPELAAMAAELALGVLEGEERAEAMRLSIANPAFAAVVREWQDKLDPLGEGFAETPAPDVWPAIAARLDSQPQAGEIRKIRFWQTSTALAGALAASLAAVMVFSPVIVRETDQAPARIVIAQLAGADGTLLAANVNPQSGQIDIRAVSLPDSSLLPELWVIPADGVPRSLGLIAPEGTTQVALPAALKPLVVDGAILAVSLETAAGAPHTAPSSTPIATGKISAI
jgi:anti-sigma-K factor RskA